MRPPPCGGVFLRKYKYVKVDDVGWHHVFSRGVPIPDSIESIEFGGLLGGTIEYFELLQKFKKLKSLRGFHLSTLTQMPNPTMLELGLRSLEVDGVWSESLNLLQELIRCNPSIESLTISCFPDMDGREFKNLIRNIHLPMLQEFSVRLAEADFEVKDELISFFQNHTNLKDCTLNEMKIDDQVIRALRESCVNLERLSLEECYFPRSNRILNELRFMMQVHRLKHLNLSHTSFPVEDLEIFNPAQLESFRLGNIYIPLSSMQTRSMLQSMSNVMVLDLSQYRKGDTYIDSSILPFIAEKMPLLFDLNITGLKMSSASDNADESLKKDFKFKRLEKLNMTDTTSTDELLCLIHAPRLRELETGSSVFSSSKGVRHIVEQSPFIETLNISECEIVDMDITFIAEHSSCLRMIDCKTNGRGLKLLLTNTLIEFCCVELVPKEDLIDVKNWALESGTFQLDDDFWPVIKKQEARMLVIKM